jgi:dephospho-CoA kinase
MTVVGLTGGIGSGKSTVASLLARRGAAVVDADAIAREVVEPDRPAFEAIVRRFGAAVVGADGRLDRAALASIVFRDDGARRDLDAIVHPAIGELVVRRVAEAASVARVVVLDVPLLVETGGRERYSLDGVLVVDAPEALVLERLAAGRKVAPDDARRRMAAQASRGERLRAADLVILNVGTLEELDAMVERAWEWARGLAARADPGGEEAGLGGGRAPGR